MCVLLKLLYLNMIIILLTDPCGISNPCQNEGTCTFNMAGEVFCRCPSGYTGDRCDQKASKWMDHSMILISLCHLKYRTRWLLHERNDMVVKPHLIR